LTPRDLFVSGRVVDAMGRPFANGGIGHWRLGSLRAQRLDGQGRFELQLSQRGAALPYRIEVYGQDPLNAKGYVCADPRLIVPGTPPGSEGLEIRVPGDDGPAAWLRGTLLTSAGSPARVEVRLAHDTGRRAWRAGEVRSAADGSFVLGPLMPGRYRLVVGETLSYGPFDVGTADLDVGSLLLPPGGASAIPLFMLRLAPLFPDHASTVESFQIEVRDAQGVLVESRLKPAGIDLSTWYSVDLPAGEFLLTAKSESGLVAERRFEVDPLRPHLHALPLVFEPR
jgi:hypothetical protein